MNDPTLFSRSENETPPQTWVTVSNEMVMARMDWDIMMHRIMMVLISQIDSRNDQKFRLQRIRIRDIRDMAQVSQKSIHQEAAAAASKLVREPIEFWSADKQDYEGYPIFSICKYKSREGVIEAKFNDDALPFLLQLSERFTQYRLKQAIPLSTPYAIRTYELAKMIERPGKRRAQQIPVSRFRQMFKLESKYSRHSDMRRRVVNPSIEEVNEKCDVGVECEDIRDGQTPIALKWKVWPSQPTASAKVQQRSSKRRTSEESSSNDTVRKLPSASQEDTEPKYRTWLDSLSVEAQRETLQEAKRRAIADNFDPEQQLSFTAGVEMKLAVIYRERTPNTTGRDSQEN
jgi:plasmid replication initiation protein